MSKKFPLNSKGFNPFGELIGLTISKSKKGTSRCFLEIKEEMLNPLNVVYGGVVYSMADTGMGAALFSDICDHEICSTIEIKIVYFKAMASGKLSCETKIVHRGNKIVTLESEIINNENLQTNINLIISRRVNK